ncbi:MAG: hypothetical protein ACI31A_08345 [Candidatus Limisoma sp.]
MKKIMLKHLKFLVLLVLPFSLAMTLTSCSDDDNDVSDEETSLLVGSWVWEDDVEPEIWTFNANGTCKTVWYDEYEKTDHIHTGKYRYDSTTGILLMSMVCDDPVEPGTWTKKYKVISISSLELVLQETEGSGEGDIFTLTRKI